MAKSDVFDATQVRQLQEATQKAWETLSNKRSDASFDEVARLVMLMAVAGVVDEDEIVKSVIRTYKL